jgi:hypothetical protein
MKTGRNCDMNSMNNFMSYFNNPKLLSPHTDSMLLRTNFYLAKEKADFRNLSSRLNKSFS